jgi:hypothetical protein
MQLNFYELVPTMTRDVIGRRIRSETGDTLDTGDFCRHPRPLNFEASKPT